MTLGYARVITAKRALVPDNNPEEGEVVVRVDRTHPVLGNAFVMNPAASELLERPRVLGLHRAHVEKEMAEKGPLYQALFALAERVAHGERLCLECHCFPRKCHADIYATIINDMAARLVSAPSFSSSEPVLSKKGFEDEETGGHGFMQEERSATEKGGLVHEPPSLSNEEEKPGMRRFLARTRS